MYIVINAGTVQIELKSVY